MELFGTATRQGLLRRVSFRGRHAITPYLFTAPNHESGNFLNSEKIAVRFLDVARTVGDRMISWSLETRRHACCLPRRFVAALLVDTATAGSRLQTSDTPTVLAAPPDHHEDVLADESRIQSYQGNDNRHLAPRFGMPRGRPARARKTSRRGLRTILRR